jgi:anti-sigma regulatory factor (Ser/Thr protein kinase)
MGPNTPDGHPGFTIIVEDRGRQIDPDAIRGRDLDQVRPGGLGVHIIRNVMDEATYARRPDRGMRLTMAKRLTPAAEVEEGQES